LQVLKVVSQYFVLE